MHDFSVEEGLRKTLDRLYKRDRQTYERVMSKIDEIVSCEDVDHYKNLRKPLQEFKRVHVGVWILLFRYSDDKLIFVKLEHHDDAYLADR